jgi:hypothetical protein
MRLPCFLLDCARLFVYRTAIEQEIKTTDIVMVLLKATVHMDDLMASASTQDDILRYARKTLTHGDVSASDAIT